MGHESWELQTGKETYRGVRHGEKIIHKYVGLTVYINFLDSLSMRKKREHFCVQTSAMTSDYQ